MHVILVVAILKATSHQTWQPNSELWGPHGRRRGSSPESYPVTYTHPHVWTHTLGNKTKWQNFFWKQKLECWIKIVPIYFLSVKKYTLGVKTNWTLGWKDRKRYSKQIKRRKQVGGAILMSSKVNFEQKLEEIKMLHIQESPSGGPNSFEHLCTEHCFMKQYWMQRHGLTATIVVGDFCVPHLWINSSSWQNIWNCGKG